VPIVFRDRALGQSKMSRDIVREAIVRVPQLRFEGGRSALRPGARLVSTYPPGR